MTIGLPHLRTSVFAIGAFAAFSATATQNPLLREAPCGASSVLTWQPESPLQGALFRVRLSGVPPQARLGGVFADQPLHFARSGADSSVAESFAAVPIDGARSLNIVVSCALGSSRDSIVAEITASSANYPVDRLTVAPRFGRAPDSATAARIRRESDRALKVAQNAHETPQLWTDDFARPRESRITSGFGHGREFNGTITSRHMGTDFAGSTGAPVRALNRGVVRIVDSFYYGGNVVYVDHGAGLTSAYLHLSQQAVAVGDTVARGQVVGRVGATGRVTGPHLHLIVRYGSITVDPLSLLESRGQTP